MRSHALLLVCKVLPKVSLLPQLMSLINPQHLVSRLGILSNYGDVWLPYQHIKLYMSHSQCWYLPCTLFSVAGGGQLLTQAKIHLGGISLQTVFAPRGSKIPLGSPEGFCSTLDQEASSLCCPQMF